jgi:hypothetical protein
MTLIDVLGRHILIKSKDINLMFSLDVFRSRISVHGRRWLIRGFEDDVAFEVRADADMGLFEKFIKPLLPPFAHVTQVVPELAQVLLVPHAANVVDIYDEIPQAQMVY